ncbi:MAG: hypothetical protein IJY85_09235 [Ruminococcus sp.]|nr:hypothetical protein [Ruminococcus sp.]
MNAASATQRFSFATTAADAMIAAENAPRAQIMPALRATRRKETTSVNADSAC